MNKPKIRNSQLGMLEKCGEMYYRRHVLGEIVPPSIAMITGTATHKPAENSLIMKADTGEIMSIEEMWETAFKEFGSVWERGGVHLAPEEKGVSLDRLKGLGSDMSVALAGVYHEKLLPVINPKSPVHVERKWIIEADGFPYDLTGTIDVEEPGVVRDLKCQGKSPSQGDADTSEQLTMYALAVAAVTGEIPEVAIDALVKLKTPKAVTKRSTRTQADFRSIFARLERFAVIIEKGAFMPTNRGNWWCGPKWCGYALTCKFYSGKVQI